MSKDNSSLDPNLKAEFDLVADQYYEQLSANISISGESPEYFSEYKIRNLHDFVKKSNLVINEICDFGSGIGNSIPYFRKYFDQSKINCVEISKRSIEISKTRFPGDESYIHINKKIDLPNNSQDLVFSACVFHHIPDSEHVYWLSEIYRITKPGGYLAIYEHNPYNPLTVKAVNTCPFDINASLINAGRLQREVMDGNWKKVQIGYKVFFPSSLKFLRPLEAWLSWIPVGAQYLLIARKE